MKHILTVLALTLSLSAFAKEGRFGLGLMLGDPTGLSGKYFMGPNAIDAGFSYGNNEFIFWGDYLMHFPGVLGKENAFVSALAPYVGGGPVLAFDEEDDKHDNNHFIDEEDDDFALGVRIPFGIEWIATEVPLGVSLEIAPGVVVLPSTDGFVQGGLALRYYF